MAASFILRGVPLWAEQYLQMHHRKLEEQECKSEKHDAVLFMMIATDLIPHDRKGAERLTTRGDKTIIDRRSRKAWASKTGTFTSLSFLAIAAR
jgi:hypothetical protein